MPHHKWDKGDKINNSSITIGIAKARAFEDVVNNDSIDCQIIVLLLISLLPIIGGLDIIYRLIINIFYLLVLVSSSCYQYR